MLTSHGLLQAAEMVRRTLEKQAALADATVNAGRATGGAMGALYNLAGTATKEIGGGTQHVLRHIPYVGPAIGWGANAAIRAVPWAAGAYGAVKADDAAGQPVRGAARQLWLAHKLRQAQRGATFDPNMGVMY